MLDNFDPVFKKSEFHIIKKNALKKLYIDIYKYGKPS